MNDAAEWSLKEPPGECLALDQFHHDEAVPV
jgi:hypothetical protein